MKFINLVVALLLLVLVSQFAYSITAKVGEGKVKLRPSFDEAGITIERVLTVINDNPYEVMVQIIEGDDAHDIITVSDEIIYLEANETGNPRIITVTYRLQSNTSITDTIKISQAAM